MSLLPARHSTLSPRLSGERALRPVNHSPAQPAGVGVAWSV